MKNITLNPTKVALVTGGATGIGAGLVKALVADGYRVYVMDRLALEESSQVRAFYGDVADAAARDAFLDFVLSEVSAVDVLVHNAMRWIPGLKSKASVADFEESLRLAAVAPYHMVLRLMDHLAPGACMVNLLSTRAFQSQADNESYATAKGALSALTHALANSCGPKLRVNAIAPGWIDTKGAPLSEADHAQHSAGRVGRVDDIVAALRYLISAEASFVHATTLVVDGGMSKRMIYHGDEGWTFTP
jgi:NAD(P)-dependent dehydrogenase (short-subunit alcohol dehydrogenase family)